MSHSTTGIRRGSKNVFADLGYPDAEDHLLKARLVSRIQDAMEARCLTQVQAGEIMGIGQPDVSRMLRGNFRDVSVERLLRFMLLLGYEIDIVVREQSRPTAADTIALRPVPA
jgi:predicted XRE-type DNA-binding protein